jgi:2-polyprenyl-3-methyl-5-hydroxy-6-metoxy-1,4-benzoquinol methylase
MNRSIFVSIYNKYYTKDNYFGNPYIELLEFFKKTPKGSLIDLGAGQGRDSIPLSQMGYCVTAVDISTVGINQIKEIEPKINAIVGDLYTYDVSNYDYVLMNSIIHFYKNDLEKETALVKKIILEMKNGSFFINCLFSWGLIPRRSAAVKKTKI